MWFLSWNNIYTYNGVPAFEWSQTLGMEIRKCSSALNPSNTEVQFGANESGYIYSLGENLFD